MECKSCNLYTKAEVLEKYGGLCTHCFKKINPHLFCLICWEPLSAEQSKAMNNLCTKHYENYKKLLPKKEQIKNIIGFLNKIFISILVISLTIIILKLNGQKEVEWEHIKFVFSKAWIIYLILTAAHLFMRTLLLNTLNHVQKIQLQVFKDDILSAVTSSDNLFFNGFIPKYSFRHKVVQLKRLNENMNFLLFILTFIFMFIANINFTKFDILSILISMAFVTFNIFIASTWTIRLSLLNPRWD